MQVLIVLLLAFAPGFLWLWVVYRRDKFRPEPRGLVIRTFLWGMAAIIPVAVVEAVVMLLAVPNAMDVITGAQTTVATAGYIAAMVGITEETAKFLVVRQTVYRSPYFDEPTDGLVYSAAAALGFASLENFTYLLSFGWQVILVRGVVSTAAHVIFAGLWGYPLARRKVLGKSVIWVWLGLAAAATAHGLFDFLLLIPGTYWPYVIPLFLACGTAFVLMFRHGSRHSPYRDMVADLQVQCPACGQRTRLSDERCANCGSPLRGDRGQASFCGKCGLEVPPDARFCPWCASRLSRRSSDRPR